MTSALNAYGLEVPLDYTKAATWFSKAAEQGDAASQFNLANLHAQGLGVSQDNVQALMWLAIAARQPNDTARGAPDIGSSAIELETILSAQMTSSNLAIHQKTLYFLTSMKSIGRRSLRFLRVRAVM
jgi:TPR repeat protein